MWVSLLYWSPIKFYLSKIDIFTQVYLVWYKWGGLCCTNLPNKNVLKINIQNPDNISKHERWEICSYFNQRTTQYVYFETDSITFLKYAFAGKSSAQRRLCCRLKINSLPEEDKRMDLSKSCVKKKI